MKKPNGGRFTAIPWGAFDATQQGNSGAAPTLMLRSTFDEAILQQAPVGALSFRSGIDSAFLSPAPTLDQSQFNSLSSGWHTEMQSYCQAYSVGTSSSGAGGSSSSGTATAVP